ncbi:probable magnesium transporter NIPA4 isoform X2 [Rhododendron vialii]|uniref:probable magnesium transporter NIPA4 isoform X2 n=1 Tax=Rhododendron vialii TaxID=182163 RepID=UPI00265DDAC2|nr:probable magnesium transporter NIPA4 isoform X2 [Rhododendron vialii]
MRAHIPNPIRQYPYPHEPKEKRGTREKKIHSIMGFSKDNLIGFLLALSSSAFIGASFIIKKKGLRKAAAASGVRAGVGGYSYLMEPLWWLGMITMITGEVANFVAYAFAPAVLVTPLGALSIIISAVLAHCILKEKLHQLGVLGCVMCIAGSVIIVIHAPQERPITSVQEIWTMATQPAFLLYVGSVIVLVFILIFYFAPQCGHSNVMVFTGICSLMGSLSVMSVKALGTSLKLSLEGNNQLIYPETWFFMIVVATCVVTQMNYLNKALDTFNTAIVSPIYYVMFTSLTIIASVIMFKDWDGQSGGSIVSNICGFIVVLSGTILLHVTRDFERSSPFKGNYAPLSPSFSAGLCNGNGELPNHEEEDEPCSEEVCLRRQELYP